jgi:NAD+-dependent farnesol dehydrogenase
LDGERTGGLIVSEGRRHATVFLTGATGFLGGRLAAALDARGYRLRCLVRHPERAGALARLGAELIVGDVTNADVITKCMLGAELAFHLAGRYAFGAVDATGMERANVEGTRVFLDSLRRSDVARAVYVSTTQALGPTPAPDGAATDDYQGPYASVYTRTKTEAHRLALAAQQEGLPLVIVCPSLVYGPGDNGPSGQYVMDVLRHRLPGLSTRASWFSYVYVDDVVSGMIAAAEQGQVGAVYVLSGEAASIPEFTRKIAEAGGTWVSPLRFPPFVVRWTGVLMDLVSRLTGVRLPISRELADMAATGERWLHSHERATAELGYAPRSLAEGLPETIRDARERMSR